MKKEYNLPGENEKNNVEEPVSEYGISKDYLLEKIAEAEKEFAEGKGIPLEEAIQRILK